MAENDWQVESFLFKLLKPDIPGLMSSLYDSNMHFNSKKLYKTFWNYKCLDCYESGKEIEKFYQDILAQQHSSKAKCLMQNKELLNFITASAGSKYMSLQSERGCTNLTCIGSIPGKSLTANSNETLQFAREHTEKE